MEQKQRQRTICCRTKIWMEAGFYANTPNAFKELKKQFIPDDDCKVLDFEENAWYFPLGVKNYPTVLSRMTARQAVMWGVSKCQSQGWEVTPQNVRSCIANREMG